MNPLNTSADARNVFVATNDGKSVALFCYALVMFGFGVYIGWRFPNHFFAGWTFVGFGIFSFYDACTKRRGERNSSSPEDRMTAAVLNISEAVGFVCLLPALVWIANGRHDDSMLCALVYSYFGVVIAPVLLVRCWFIPSLKR